MKSIIFILFAFTLFSCADSDVVKTEDKNEAKIPEQLIDKNLLVYNNKTSEWLLNGDPYSGYATSNYSNGERKEKFGLLNGRKQNEAIQWYRNGTVRMSSHYHAGKLHGGVKTWSTDTAHVLISQLNYTNGKLHGIQRKWYDTGEPFKILNMHMGIEEGIQQAFRKNGVLYANYEAKNGRIFGLKKAALCFDLEDEQVKL